MEMRFGGEWKRWAQGIRMENGLYVEKEGRMGLGAVDFMHSWNIRGGGQVDVEGN